MSYEKTGGPVFPVIDSHHPLGGVEYCSIGMTLRDYFAAKAMVAYMTTAMTDDGDQNVSRTVAMVAYLMADEMLKARGQE